MAGLPIPRDRSKDREREAERLAEVRAIKVAKGCADCGFNSHPAALDFDHLPGTIKLFDIGNAAGRWTPWDLVLLEIAKCEVVCANCHRIRTFERRT
jgi:hypothetical protein